MIKIRLKEIVCVFCCIILSGCLAGGSSKEAEDLHTVANTYGKLIRWRAYDEAAGHIRRRDGQPPNVNTEALKEIRVTKYEVLTIILNDEQTEANVTAEISYYHERVNSVRTIRDKQLWWKDIDSGGWFIDGELPALAP